MVLAPCLVVLHDCYVADCNLKAQIAKKPQRKVYWWSKADWLKIKRLTTMFAESFLTLQNCKRQLCCIKK